MTEITSAIIIIGSEILSGRTQDENIQYLGKRLSELGVHLKQVRIIGDDVSSIVDAVRELAATHTYVFTTGGLGFTHDDRTAEALAKAFNVEIGEHPEALQRLRDYYGNVLNPARRRMALIPVGASLIDNPISNAPGFQIENVFVLAGVPDVMKVMFEGFAARLVGGKPIRYVTIACQLPEGVIADELSTIQQKHSEVEIGSYPSFRVGILGVSLVIKGLDEDLIDKAAGDIAQMIQNLGGEPIVG